MDADLKILEAAVRAAIDQFGLERFAKTLTSKEQGQLGSPTAQ